MLTESPASNPKEAKSSHQRWLPSKSPFQLPALRSHHDAMGFRHSYPRILPVKMWKQMKPLFIREYYFVQVDVVLHDPSSNTAECGFIWFSEYSWQQFNLYGFISSSFRIVSLVFVFMKFRFRDFLSGHLVKLGRIYQVGRPSLFVLAMAFLLKPSTRLARRKG